MAHRHSAKNNLDKALASVEAMRGHQALSHLERAFKASLLLRQQQFEDAKSLCMDVIEETDDDPSPNKMYFNAYCRAMVHGMHGNTEDEVASEQLAATLPCDPVLRRWLPL